MTEQRAADSRLPAPRSLRPGEFSRLALATLAASEGRRKRRKRDTTPDAIGLGIKRELLERATEEDPAPEAFESWLVAQTLQAPAGGPVRALAAEIFTEYQFAASVPDFSRWLAQGAPSADAEEDSG